MYLASGRDKDYLLQVNNVPHSWFISVVDTDELGPVQPVQVKQSKYVDHEDEGAMGAMMTFMLDFGINIHIQ